MKRNFFSLVMAVIVIAVGMSVTACTSMMYKIMGVKKVESNSFMDPAIPVEEHAVLTVDKNIQITMIDGRGALIDGNKKMLLVLPSGKHTLHVSYFNASLTYGNGGKSYSLTQTSSNIASLSDTFLPGHFYWIDYRVSGSSITFILNDETDPTVHEKKGAQNAAEKRNNAAKKVLASAKYPKNAYKLYR
jgi:hypothetical protein